MNNVAFCTCDFCIAVGFATNSTIRFNGIITTCMILYYASSLWLGNIKMYLEFISFLHTDMTQVIEILSHETQKPIPHMQHIRCWCPGNTMSQCIRELKSFLMQHKNQFFIVNIMGSDVLATQGVSTSAIMILIALDRKNLVSAR